MKAHQAAISGFFAGAAAVYFGDPARGRRRRIMLRDRSVATWHDLRKHLDKAQRDLRNRSHGFEAGARSFWAPSGADGAVLEERVRARIGRSTSHPHLIDVRAERDGRIVLEGMALEHEIDYLLKCVRSVRGVSEVVNRLNTRSERNNVPGLQGGVARRERSEIFQRSWTPGLRVGAGALSGAGVLYCMTATDGGLRAAGVVANLAILARAVTNKGFREIFGVRPRSETVHIDKAIHVFAPVEEVFGFWSSFENLPRFMTHLKEVQDLGNGRTHWVAAGPGGVSIPWVAETTQFRKNELLAWRSVPGSLVRTSGVVRFDAEPDGRTRITIRMSYCPPAGLIGHGIAVLFGADPKSEMDDDLARFKSLVELGKTHAHHAAVFREQLMGTARASNSSI